MVGPTHSTESGALGTFPRWGFGKRKGGACPWELSGSREGDPGVIYMAFESEKNCSRNTGNSENSGWDLQLAERAFSNILHSDPREMQTSLASPAYSNLICMHLRPSTFM